MREQAQSGAAADPSVTVYGTAWCELTRALRIYLIQQRVGHRFHNVELEAEDGAAALTLQGGRYEVPVVAVGERLLKNPQLAVLARELARRELLGADELSADESATSLLLEDEARGL